LNIQDWQNLNIQDWQKQLRGYADPLFKITLAVLFGLFVFEATKDFLAPDLTLWQSHTVTIIFGTVLAVAASYFFLRKQSVLYQQVLEENENYKKSEEELRRSKEWFRSLIENSTDLITVLDPKGTILYESPSLERILGYRPIDRQGINGFDLIHPEDLPRARSVLARAFEKLGSLHTIEVRQRGQDGLWHLLEATGKAVLDQHGAPCWVINSRDITQRRQAHEALSRSEAKFRLLFESNSDAVMLLDEKGFVDCNEATLTLFGCATREEFLAKHPANVSPPEQPSGTSSMILANQQIATAIEKGSHRFEWVHKRADTGKTFPAEVQLTAVELDGKPILWAVVHDITERKHQEMKAKQLARLMVLGQLIGGIAHEMKNPLFILSGRIQIAREKLAHQEYAALESDMKKIDEAGERMKTIADRFMTIAKPVPLHQEQCSMQAILHKSMESLANELTQNRIRVETAFAPDLPGIQSDPRQLYEVFLNLMQNAVQAMTHVPGERRLTVSSTREGTWVVARIQDNGPGIAPEHRVKLFEPFFSTAEQGKGPGLGLWIVRSTLMMLKGEVACESEVGKGTTFIVRLPVAA